MMKLPEFTGIKQSKPIEQIDPMTGKVVKEWCSIAEASRKLRITKYYISNVLLGRRQEAGGFKWRYKKDAKVCDHFEQGHAKELCQRCWNFKDEH